jgi:hypothetical protein
MQLRNKQSSAAMRIRNKELGFKLAMQIGGNDSRVGTQLKRQLMDSREAKDQKLQESH